MAEATEKLSALENEWRVFHNKHAGHFDELRFRKNFLVYCDKRTWRKMGMDPGSFIATLNAGDVRRLYEGALLLEFMRAKKLVYVEEQAGFASFLASGRGTCTVMTTVALHLFKISGGTDFNPVIMTEHITLGLETTKGMVYLGAGSNLGFQPPLYYETKNEESRVQRVGEMPAEPWQVLANVYYNVGKGLYDERKYEDAVRYFEAALEIYPEFANAEYALGCALNAQGDRKGALEHFNKALEINPDYSLARRELNKMGD